MSTKESSATGRQGDALAVLKGFYAAELSYMAAGGPGRARFDEVAAFLDPEVVLHQAAGLPFGGTWRGHDGMERFFAAFSATWSSLEILKQEYLVRDERVVVINEIRARARATDTELEFQIVQLITVRHGLIAEVRPFYWDTAAIAAACAG